MLNSSVTVKKGGVEEKQNALCKYFHIEKIPYEFHLYIKDIKLLIKLYSRL